VLLLGPGTSITHAAVKVLAESGCSIVWTGEEVIRCYAQGIGETRKAYHLLRQAITLLKSKEIGVNWQNLLWDVRRWRWNDEQRDRVRKEWSRAFWRSREVKNADESSPDQ
jgi:CRISPR/Cas system-associated endonuclease Cas1